MKRNINIRGIPEELYFKTLELKAKLKARNWVDFLERVNRIVERAKTSPKNT